MPRRLRTSTAAAVVPLLLLPLLLAGCNDRQPQQELTGLMPLHGDPKHGVQVIRDIGCGNCHTIPGVRGADGVVGPSSAGIGRRVFLAGVLRNTPANMVLWLRKPQAVIPGNAMPDSGLSEAGCTRRRGLSRLDRPMILCVRVLLAAAVLLPAIAQARELRVCDDPNNLPFSNDKLEGFENKIVDLIAKDLGATGQIHVVGRATWVRAQHAEGRPLRPRFQGSRPTWIS